MVSLRPGARNACRSPSGIARRNAKGRRGKRRPSEKRISDTSWRFIVPGRSSRVVGEDFVERKQDIVLVLLGHRREEWERDEPLLDGLRHGAQSGTVAEALAIERMPVDERVVERRADVLGAQGLEDCVPVGGKAVESQQHQEEMPAMPSIRRQRRQLHEWRGGKSLAVATRKLVTPFPETLELLELTQPERRL